MSHSKRNTSRAVFTSHERALAKAAWNTSSARLSRDSFLPFASCRLCLETAIDPVSCSHGDIFCRECALNNILAQKKEIKRLEKAREHEDREAVEEKARQDAEAQERAVREFELTQAGFDLKAGRGAASAKTGQLRREGSQQSPAPQPTVTTEPSETGKRGEKRKFSFNEDEVARIAEEERAKARKAIDDERSAKPSLPSFWTPSVTPTSNKNNVLHEVKRKTKTQPVCPSSPQDKPHYYSLHTLITVHFTEDKDEKTKAAARICPACKKVLSNSSKAMLAKPCGHVVCGSCVNTFMKPQGHHDPHAPDVDPDAVRCYVCEADLTEEKDEGKKKASGKKEKEGREKIRPGLVEIRREGTGFSAGGNNEVKKEGVSFQC